MLTSVMVAQPFISSYFYFPGASEVESTLLKNLFSNYTLKVRPAVSPEQRVVVRVGMSLSSFVGLVRL